MVLHARPHLETHSRGAGHSAIAGVAYRLGLRLLDRRTGQWHDYRRRKLGEEIVRALTVAPEGAPAWATDPAELWARAETAEKRKDAQVARDYRIPVPFGLTDKQAGDLAEEMARFICQELHTAVSMGLHRDGELDALGALKPSEKQGFHAHLYFPTRKLEELEQADGTSAWGLGAKLVLLSNKNSSGAFVERLNEKWAELANQFMSANSLPADFDHRSYVRQELPITPQPTLGAAVTAMERRGFFTRRGDALRGDIMVPSLAYEAAHAVVLDVQRKQAVEDAIRERTDPVARAARLVAEASSASAMPPQSDTPAVAPIAQAPLAKPPLNAPVGSLVARFHAAAPPPTTLEERQIFARVLKIVAVVERVLAALGDLANRLRKHAEDQGRRMAAKLDMDYQLDGCRNQRAAAKEKLEQWEANHKWQVATARTFGGGDGGRSKAWQFLIGNFDACQRRMQTLKAALRSHQVHLDAFAIDEAALQVEQANTTDRLTAALGTLAQVNQEAIDTLVSVAEGAENVCLRAYLPDPATLPDEMLNGPEQVETVARLRPRGRRMVGAA
jgi:hypothetical protein